MKDFAGKNMLRRLDVGGKLVYSAFLLFAAGGLLTAALLHGDGMGSSATSAATYWTGDESGMVYPKSYRQILELTHFHLFTEPVTFLVVAHLYNLGSGPIRRRATITALTILAMGIQIALPWLVVYVNVAFSVLFIPAHAMLLAGLLWMSFAALWEMWRP